MALLIELIGRPLSELNVHTVPETWTPLYFNFILCIINLSHIYISLSILNNFQYKHIFHPLKPHRNHG